MFLVVLAAATLPLWLPDLIALASSLYSGVVGASEFTRTRKFEVALLTSAVSVTASAAPALARAYAATAVSLFAPLASAFALFIVIT